MENDKLYLWRINSQIEGANKSMNTQLNSISGYLSRLAQGGVSLVVLDGKAQPLPRYHADESIGQYDPTMGAYPDVKPLPEGTRRAIEAKQDEIMDFFVSSSDDADTVYPYLTPEEVSLSELVLDWLSDGELTRYAEHKALYGGAMSDRQTAPSAPRRGGMTARQVDRANLPEYHTTPADRRAQKVLDALARLDRANTKACESTWDFEKSDDIKWVKRTKPDGKTSVHIMRFDEDGTAYCDCPAKGVRIDEPCVHEIARTGELARRGL